MPGKPSPFLFLGLSFLCLSSTLHAQRAQITGEVRDTSGGVLVKAAVRVINQATLVERHTTTNDAGVYTVPYLDPSSYQVAVEASGFQTAVSTVTLTVDQVLVLNFQLKVGEANIKVEVKAPPETIDLNDAQISDVVDSRQMNALPLITRDPYDLMGLVAGVNPSDNFGFAVNGGRVTNNNFRLDGADSNDVEGGSGSIVAINPESAQEFRVLTNNFMPEYGRDNGAVVDVVTKSGTNHWHGGVYEFGRWNWLAGARDFFNPAPAPMSPYNRNLFGGTLSGPIVRDKTFFFFNYEAQRFVTALTNSAVVPTQGFLQGKFTFNGTDPFTGNPISVPIDVSNPSQNTFGLTLDPTIQQIFSHFPVGSNSSSPDGIGSQIFFPAPDRSSGNNFTLKIDHNFSSSETLSVRYVGNPGKDNGVATDFLPGIGSFPTASVTQLGAIHLVSTFTSTWINDFLFGVSNVNTHNACGNLNLINSVRPTDRFGDGTDFSFSDGMPVWGCPGQTNSFTELSGTYSWSDHMTRILGRHSMTFGLEFAALHSNSSQDFFSRPQVDFINFGNNSVPAIVTGTDADFIESLQDSLWALFGEVNTQLQSQTFNPATKARLPNDLIHMRENDYTLFWQDSFKVNKNFTFNYGLRWELNGAPYETNNLLSAASLATLSGPPPVVFHVASGPGHSLYPSDHFALQPRFGFAWDPFGKGKTSIRGGYGVFRDHLFFGVADIVRANPPVTIQQSQRVFIPNPAGFTGSTITALPIPGDFTSTASIPEGAGVTPFLVDPNLHLPYSQNWNFGIQHDLGGNVQLEINYVGVQGKRLQRPLNGNPPDPAKVAALRAFCADPTYNPALPFNPPNPANPLGCIDSPNAHEPDETVQGTNLYFGAETPGPNSTPTNFVPLLPFDAVSNNAIVDATTLQTGASSTYHALQATVTKRYSQGVYLQGAYTWSHEIDDAAGNFAPSIDNALFAANNFDLRQERGNGAQDVRQALVLDFTAELPAGRGKPFLNHGFVGKTLEGWTFSGIARFQGGFPYDIFEFRDSEGTAANFSERPNYNPHGTLVPVLRARTQVGPNPGLFSDAPFGSVGNLGRNTFRVPYTNNWDTALSKNTHLSERLALEFRAEAYNLFNRVQLAAPPFFFTNIDEAGPFFGQSVSEVGRPDATTGARQMQFALKLNF
jgi:hypothetical protein